MPEWKKVMYKKRLCKEQLRCLSLVTSCLTGEGCLRSHGFAANAGKIVPGNLEGIIRLAKYGIQLVAHQLAPKLNPSG